MSKILKYITVAIYSFGIVSAALVIIAKGLQGTAAWDGISDDGKLLLFVFVQVITYVNLNKLLTRARFYD